MRSYYPEELNGFFMVGSCGYFHFNIIYSQLAAIDNVVLGGHDREACFTVSAENFVFAGIAGRLIQFVALICGPLEVAVGC